jgi:predicted nucleic acid-binding protein
LSVLVDTSVWVHHLNRGEPRLISLLEAGDVWCHPFVLGELACGRIANRREILGLLAALPIAPVAQHDEVLHFMEQHRLYGRGLGWIDVHLLGSAVLSSCDVWTSDKALQGAAERLGIALDFENRR